MAALAAVLIAICTTHITEREIDKDSAQSVMMAVNLVHHGIISLDDQPPYLPSDYREPVPVLVSALGVALIDAVQGPSPEIGRYLKGERLRYLKMQNVLWLALLTLGVFWAVTVATASYAFSFAAAVLAGLLFSANNWAAGMIDDLYTDLPAGAILVLASAALASALPRADKRGCLLAGALFGVLTLIKAAVLYVFIGTLALVACVIVLFRSRVDLRAASASLAITALAFAGTVTPWMARNAVDLGSFQVAQRAGVILMIRAVKDQMTPLEYAGAFYVWAPGSLQAPIGRLLGFGPQDLQKGGRLQHLNRSNTSDFAASDLAAEQEGRPEDAVSYYRRARAERVKLERELSEAQVPNAGVAADKLLQKRALELIESHPGRHLAATIPFLWRGATAAFPILLIGLIVAVRRHSYETALLALPSFGLVMFYALLSHFIPRYSVPVRPVLVALIVIAAKLAWDRLRARRTVMVTT